jgi:hypothetical protein
MKKQTLLLIACAFGYVSSIHAQCTKRATSFGNNNPNSPTYVVKGDVDVVLNTGGTTLTLNLGNNFSTAPGPDVKVFLVNPNGLTDTQLKTFNPNSTTGAMNSILFGNVSTGNSNPNGAKTFNANIPSGKNISLYTKVFFYCSQFSAFWDFGTIASFSTCSTLSLEDSSLTSFNIFPNPVQDELTINLDQFSNDLKVNIYDPLGSLVYSKNNLALNDNKVNISHFNNGLYFLEVSDNENKTFVKRFIKE